MINTKEKIWMNAFQQTLKAIGDANDLRVCTYGAPETPELFTEDWYNSNDLRWVPITGADQVIHGDEPKGTAPISYADLKTQCETKFTKECYQRFRKAEYPPVEDYLDAVVKDDATAKQAYIDRCKAIKTKYAKDMTHPGNDKLIEGRSRIPDS